MTEKQARAYLTAIIDKVLDGKPVDWENEWHQSPAKKKLAAIGFMDTKAAWGSIKFEAPLQLQLWEELTNGIFGTEKADA